MKTITILCALLLAPVVAADVPVVHGGVALDVLTPPGMQRRAIEAPAAAGRPVRVTFGTADAVELWVDVVVAPDAAAARGALDEARRTLEHAPPAEALGDEGCGAGDVHLFVRDNVFVEVRRVAGDADAAAIAARIDAAIVAAPAGPPTLDPLPVLHFDDNRLAAAPAPLDVPGDLVAARAAVHGPAYARRTAAGGWVLVRTGPGEVEVRIVGVDAFLRTTR